MSKVLDEAVTQLAGKMKSGTLPGVVKFVMTGEGAIMLDAAGVRAADEAADVTLTRGSPRLHRTALRTRLTVGSRVGSVVLYHS